MPVEPSIRHANQIVVKAALRNPVFVSRHQQDGLALRIKGKSNTPYASIGIKAQLLHVGVARTLQRIDLRSSKERSLLAKVDGQGNQFFLNDFRQAPVLRDKLLVEYNLPLVFIMLHNA